MIDENCIEIPAAHAAATAHSWQHSFFSGILDVFKVLRPSSNLILSSSAFLLSGFLIAGVCQQCPKVDHALQNASQFILTHEVAIVQLSHTCYSQNTMCPIRPRGVIEHVLNQVQLAGGTVPTCRLSRLSQTKQVIFVSPTPPPSTPGAARSRRRQQHKDTMPGPTEILNQITTLAYTS